MRTVEARAEMANEDVSAEINKTKCFSNVVASVICVMLERVDQHIVHSTLRPASLSFRHSPPVLPLAMTAPVGPNSTSAHNSSLFVHTTRTRATAHPFSGQSQLVFTRWSILTL